MRSPAPSLNWLGKEAVINHHQQVPYKTLELIESFGCERGKSGNKIIHGDNLEALKALLPEYEGRVKCIYIDPPYNTGNEGWIYNDNVNSPKIRKWLGQVVGKEAEDLTRHDKWLCMMYPRLKLLHRLLREDGAIFISIDDNEQANLKLICDEIFGSGNFVGQIARKQSSGAKNDTSDGRLISISDYIICYKKNHFRFKPFKIENTKKFKLQDELGFFSIRALEMQGGGDTLPERSKMGYSIYYNKETNDVKLLFDYDLNKDPVYEEPNKEFLEQGYECYRPRKRDMALGIWRWGDETFMKRFKNNGVYFSKDRVFMKERATDYVEKYPESLLTDFLNALGTNELKEIFNQRVFDFPKPLGLLTFIFSIVTNKNSIILDSFAGSGTTAHAVLNLNKSDGGNRKFILVEMEDYAESITAERVRRVIKGYGEGKNSVEGTGGDFNYYELGPEMLIDGNINENQPVENIRNYIYYTETNSLVDACAARENGNEYFLGCHENTAYYLFYKRAEVTTLDAEFLGSIGKAAERYVIYADNCVLSKDFLFRHGITFKKIPRDVRKF